MMQAWSCPAAAADPCAAAPDLARARVASVADTLDLLLDDGRVLALAGVETPQDWRARARAYLSSQVEGGTIAWRALQAAPDRWGRLPSLVFAEGSDAPLQAALLTEGLARARVPGRTPCRALFLDREARGRDEGAGLWLDPAQAILEADAPELASRAGETIVVEGRIFSVAASGYRTYVNFGPRRYRDLSVTVLQPDAKMFDKGGRPLAALAGHRVRVRGVLDLKFGPQIEIADPEAIEFLDGAGPWPTTALR